MKIIEAMNLANEKFDLIKDKGGNDYIEHCIYVSDLAVQLAVRYDNFNKKEIEAIGVAGVLHDIVEDTDITIEYIENKFGFLIAGIVQSVTRKKNEVYMDFILRCKKNKLATYVKIADINHNMNLNRIPNITETDLSRIKRYKKALDILI